MAKSTIRIRFVLGKGGAAQQVSSQARSAILASVEGVTASYAKGTYNQVKATIASRIERDVMVEIGLMAGTFKRALVGIGKGNRGPRGFINMAHELSTASRAAGILPTANVGAGIRWPARSKSYLNWKRNNYGHARWFFNEGTIASLMGKRGAWTQAYGPVRVTVSPGGSASRSSLGRLSTRDRVSTRRGYVRYRSAEDSHIKHLVAQISVSAFGNITPAMLPALSNGTMGSYNPDGRASGLIGMLPDPVAFRLGGAKRSVPYRHTVEPFLSFVLTRSVPNALFLRVERGLKAKLDIISRRSR